LIPFLTHQNYLGLRHWALITVNLSQRKMIYYDSYRDSSDYGQEIMKNLQAFFESVLRIKEYQALSDKVSQKFNSSINGKYKTNSVASLLDLSSTLVENYSQQSPHVELNKSFNSEDSDISYLSPSECEDSLIFNNDMMSEAMTFRNYSECSSVIMGNFNREKWTIKTANTPKQNNKVDGGVFVLKFIEYLTRNEPITFSQEDIEYFRIKIAIELTENKLLTS
jgi:hypothetical protein